MLRVFCPCDMTTVESLSGGRFFFLADESIESNERHTLFTSSWGLQLRYARFGAKFRSARTASKARHGTEGKEGWGRLSERARRIERPAV